MAPPGRERRWSRSAAGHRTPTRLRGSSPRGISPGNAVPGRVLARSAPRGLRNCAGKPGWLAAGGGTRVSAEAGQFSRWGRDARLTRRVREEPPPGELARVYSDRNATMSGAQRRGSAGMDRRPSPHRENWAAWVPSPAVWPGWIAGRAPTGRTGPRGFHYRLFGRDGSPAEPPPGELGRVGSTTGWLGPSGSARASGKTVDSKFPHQSGNPLAPHPPSLHPQFPVDSRRAVLAVMAGVDAADLLLEKLVHPGAATLGTTLPSVVTAPRDSERAGHGGDSVLSPVPVHEPVDHLVIHGAGETPSVHASRRLLAQAHRRRFRKTAATGVDFRP